MTKAILEFIEVELIMCCCSAMNRWRLFKEFLLRHNPALRAMTIKAPCCRGNSTSTKDTRGWHPSDEAFLRVCVRVCSQAHSACFRHNPHFITATKQASANHVTQGFSWGRENEQMSPWRTTLFLMFHWWVPVCQNPLPASKLWMKFNGGFPVSKISSFAPAELLSQETKSLS